MTPKFSPILWWPIKTIHRIFTPQKIFIFWKPQKILIFKILNPKNDPSLRMYENIRVPPGAISHRFFWYMHQFCIYYLLVPSLQIIMFLKIQVTRTPFQILIFKNQELKINNWTGFSNIDGSQQLMQKWWKLIAETVSRNKVKEKVGEIWTYKASRKVCSFFFAVHHCCCILQQVCTCRDMGYLWDKSFKRYGVLGTSLQGLNGTNMS